MVLAENHAEPARVPSSQPFAKLIDRELAASLPHLRAHQGQIVLGQNQLHMVANSVPPLSGGSLFYPLLNAIYKATGKSWQQQSWQPSLDINISTMNGESLPLIGQDVEQNNQQPRLISYFRSSRPEVGQIRLDMEWLGETQLVRVSMTRQGGTAPLRWRLRLDSANGEEHWIPFDHSTFLGMTVSLFPEVFTILSPAPLLIKKDRQQTWLSAGILPGRDNAFLLLTTREAVMHQAALVTQFKQCRSECLHLPTHSETWRIHLPWREALVRPEKRLFQSLFVHDAQGAFLSTLPVFEGEPLKWYPPREMPWEMLYPDSQGILQKLAFDKDTLTARLPPLALGTFQVQLEPGRPVFVDIRDAVRSNGIGWAPQLASQDADVLSAHLFLQKTWPMTAELPAGDYRLHIRNGMQQLCSQRFTILPGRHQVLSCQGAKPGSTLSLRASLGFDPSPSPEMLEAADFQAIGRLIRTGRENAESLNEIPMLMVEDQDIGLSLRAFPADDKLRKDWLLVKPREHAAQLPAFAKFARQQNPPLQLVLGCPQAGFQFEDYRWLALTVEPDIMEVLGCQPPDPVDALLQIAHKLQQKRSSPIKLAASAPFSGRGFELDYIPALYVPEARNVLQALQNGAYSLGLRSEILITGPLPQAEISGPQILELAIRSLDLKDQPALLRLHDQHGLLVEEELPPVRETEQKLKIPVRLKPRSRFLRVELLRRGQTASSAEDGMTQPFLLATSNFLRLNGPP